MITATNTQNGIVFDLSVMCDDIEKIAGFDVVLKTKQFFCRKIEEYLSENYKITPQIDFNRFNRTLEYLGEVPVIDNKGLHWEYRAKFKIVNLIQKQTSALKETTLNKHKKTQTT